MSYYMGDYYGRRGTRGDYYRGDPFSIGGLVGGIGKVIGGALGGLVTGGPLGALGGAVGGLTTALGGGAGGAMIGPRAPVGIAAMPGVGSIVGPMKPKPGIVGAMERFLPFGETGYYRAKRMNVTNPRALRRAIRRVSGFGKLVSRSKKAIAKANTAVGNKSGRRR